MQNWMFSGWTKMCVDNKVWNHCLCLVFKAISDATIFHGKAILTLAGYVFSYILNQIFAKQNA